MRRNTRDEILAGFLAINAMLRKDLHGLKRTLKKRSAETKYNPNWAKQPRAPRGVPEGGQWVDGGSKQSSTTLPRSTPGTLEEPQAVSRPATTEPRAEPVRIPLSFLRASPLALQLSGDTPQPIVTSKLVTGTSDLLLVEVFDRQANQRHAHFRRVLEPRRQVPLILFDVDTGLSYFEPPRTEILSVRVVLSGDHVVFDGRELARAYGREIPGITSGADSVTGRPSLPAPTPGFAIETFDQEEAEFVAAWRAAGRSAQQIQTGLDTMRRNRATDAASSLRRNNEPGRAHATRQIPVVRGIWLRGSDRNAGIFPGQIAARLQGRAFRNFGEFRRAFWSEVANTPELAREFEPEDLVWMRRGYAPVAPREQWLGGQIKYIIHHQEPISGGGSLYDMSNMMIVTPRYHNDVLSRGVHFRRRRRRQR